MASDSPSYFHIAHGVRVTSAVFISLTSLTPPHTTIRHFLIHTIVSSPMQSMPTQVLFLSSSVWLFCGETFSAVHNLHTDAAWKLGKCFLLCAGFFKIRISHNLKFDWKYSTTEGFWRFCFQIEQMAFLPSAAVPLFIRGTRLVAGRAPSVGF